MRLRSLDLQGYKTFATKTAFAFDEGITAIVGPNGSGKSNIADAIRWVLGEQSYRLLRAKRSEDMIFHGSAQRSRVGMAQATLTLDNTERWLPIDFSEVTIARRAYRAGENEYYVNGSRVRLRDVVELLAKAGLDKKSSIVIGQGHIDAALSLRPEERRALFEEAANITFYQSQRAAALSKLEATEQNILRVQDIVSEIGPRLKTLQRQAQQAEVYHTLSKELEDLLRVWYGYQWRQGREALTTARDALNRARQVLASAQGRVSHLDSEAASLRIEQAALRTQIAGWHQSMASFHTDLEKVQRDMAVTQERIRLTGRQIAEIGDELVPLKASRNAQAERVRAAEARLQALTAEWEKARAAQHSLEEQYQAQQQARQETLAQVTAVQNRLFDLATQLADRRNRIRQIVEREQEQSREREEQSQSISQQQSELAELKARRTDLETRLAEVAAEIARLQDAAREAESAVRTCQERIREGEAGLARLREEEASLTARREMLARMQEEMVGFYSGPKAVLAASRKGELPGILGAVAEHLETPPKLEKAIETALGGHLQDIITETWGDAERAIQRLHREEGGRATFLPLETLRPPAPLRPPARPGLLGVASQLVKVPQRLAPVAHLLLGHTLVAEDMKAARSLYQDLQGSFQIVTLQGELIRSTGAVTGGTDTRKAQGLLSRGREQAELETRIEQVRQKRASLEEALRSIAADEEAARKAAAQAEQQVQAARPKASEHTASLAALQRQADKKSQEIEWRRALVGQMEQTLESLREKREQAENGIADLTQAEQAALAELQARNAELQALPDNLAVPLTEAKAAVSLAEQNASNQQAILRSHQQSLAQLQSQIDQRQSRLAALEAECAELETQEAGLRRRAADLNADLDGLRAQIQPAEARLNRLETSYADLEQAIQRDRNALRDAEQAHNQALLEMERRRDELASVKRQMERDLGLVDVEAANGWTTQPPLPLRPVVQSLPDIDALPPDLEEQIQQLRGQIRRMGAINPTAPAEYAETLERHNFLATQSQDLQEGAKSLRVVIGELDEIMNREFVRVVEAVAEQFTDYFTRLFGGGTARLVLVDPENPMTSGVDIIARPPGKRTQSLALLSGGERSLTAVALIFAILKVSPTPFCVLDEVDAMLDESNIRRFRDVLVELSRTTQFIVVTHNRGTIEAARTIYGISMGADSVSRTLSLQLDQVDAKA